MYKPRVIMALVRFIKASQIRLESTFWAGNRKGMVHLVWNFGLVFKTLSSVLTRCTSILEEVRNVEISRATQQLLNGKFHDFIRSFL